MPTDTKNYRLSEETVRLLAAIRKARPRQYLSYDELLREMAEEFLKRKRILNGEVTRILASENTDGDGD